MKVKSDFGAKFEAELWRDGKLVPDEPKPTIDPDAVLVQKDSASIMLAELTKKEKSHE